MKALPKSNTNEAHLLEDLAKMYDSGYELVLGEAIGNAVDINSTKIAITIATDEGGKYIEFHNNGKPMVRSDFDIYHTLAESTKTYGISLGWAGLGSKLYLGKKKDAKITTVSSDGTTTNASVMYLKNQKELWHDFIESDQKFKGTKYRVTLTDEDYDVLIKHAESLIIGMFNIALINGLSITVNKKQVIPWSPLILKQKDCILKIDNRNIAFTIWATKGDIPTQKSNTDYHVSGKTIVSRTPKNLLASIKKDYRRKFFIIVNAMEISDQLQTTKKSFFPGLFTSKVEPGIEKKALEILKDWGYVEKQTNSMTHHKKLSKIIEDILKQIPELKMEGPAGASKGSGKSKGKGTKTSKKKIKKNSSNQKKNPKKPRSKGGLSITTVYKEDDPRQGWTQIETNEIVVNLAHRAAKMVSKTAAGKEYHILRVVSNELVKNAAKKAKLDVEKALEYSDIIFDGLAKIRAENPRSNPWNLKDSNDAQRDEDGRFVSK